MAVASPLRLLALHALRLRGLAEADAVADYVLADPEAVAAELAALLDLDLVTYRHGRIGGFALTPEGKVLEARLLADELEQHQLRPAIQAAYDEFLGFNRQLLTVCTSWQLRTDGTGTVANDHSDATHDEAVIGALVALDAKVRPVLAALCDALDRFAGHDRRLRIALDHVLAGEHDWFTKPMFPSYHSVWFELHEDLLATLGTERHTEGSP